ncbi:hypothetical protein [Clostridium magnum]|uniref:hypothetical protein n=1 Tax=Clostridium magnum TaxID=33954 RepID=UPI000911A7B2|nr:hypothetical protein [Clostridium magnum]SHI51899.1 hypothetical protein SAMN02745944_04437 [Clostridium magnum DSM 2767]
MNLELKNKNFIDEWDKARSKGKMNYVIRKGILFYGIFYYTLTWVAFSLARDFFRNDKLGTFLREWFKSKNSIIYHIISCIIIGTFIGIWNWNSNEKRYNNIKIKSITNKNKGL